MSILSKETLLRERFPWDCIVAPGCIVLNKNGSLQQTFEFRGPDLDSVTSTDMDIMVKKINNILRRLPGGWALFADAHRINSMKYPTSKFPDPISKMIDEERKIYFQEGQHYESRFYLTLYWLPPSDKVSTAKEFFIERAVKKRQENYKNYYVKNFKIDTERVFRLLGASLYEIRPLTNNETMTYLHSCVSTKKHPVNTYDAYKIDYQITDTGLTPGLEPLLGKHHLRTISLLQFPNFSTPGIFDILNQLDFEYRWMTRFIPMDKQTALSTIKEFTRKWFNNRQSAFDMIKQVFTEEVSLLQNNDAVTKSRDSDQAAQEVAADAVSFGYYTMSIVVMDEDYNNVEKKVQKIEEVIGSKGFTTIAESYNAVNAWFSSLPGITDNLRSPILSSLNLAHMLPISAKWAGPELNKAWGGSPLIYAQTNDMTPFRFDLHTDGDVGHTLIVGPTGAGKSLLVSLMAAQSRRYPNSQCFIFDKGGSARVLAAGVGGTFFDLGQEGDGALSFQPLARLELPNEIDWALEWILLLIQNEGIAITPTIKKTMWDALQSVKASPIELRRMSTLYSHTMDEQLREVIYNYTELGPYGKLFDADNDNLEYNRFQVFEMETLMENKKSVVEPTLAYLFHRLEAYFSENTPKPTLLILDEAWTYLISETFSAKINKWLRELRKKKVDVIFATQSLSEIEKSPLTSVIIDSCKTKVYLPNSEALLPANLPLYRSFGLNDREIQIIAEAIGKRQYYFSSPKGRRLMEFGMENCPLGLAYCGANSREDQEKAKEIITIYGKENFNKHWLSYKKLPEHMDVYESVFRFVDYTTGTHFDK